MSRFAALKGSASLHDVALIFDMSPSILSHQLYIKPKAGLYSKFDIPKRSGGVREIWAPEKELKLLQFRLAGILQDAQFEINAAKPEYSRETPDHLGMAHGFKRKRSILTNARPHKGKRFVFNLDLTDFFGTINFGRVRGFFIKDRNFALNPKVATILAQIACHENKLPQGSPSSPVVSNLIAHSLDIHLAKLASSTSCTYTRYADDLTFSTNERDFPFRVATQNEGEWVAGNELTRLIRRAGFDVNVAKTRMQYRDSRQEVTGLTVNRQIGVRREYRHRTRAMVANLIRTGEVYIDAISLDQQGKPQPIRIPLEMRRLRGMLSFAEQVDNFNSALHKKQQPEPVECVGRGQLYRQFIVYEKFYSSQIPVVLCEGDSDNVYLSHAIHSLAAKYPSLTSVDAEGKTKLAIRLHKYSNKQTARVLRLGGGTGDLANFITEYRRQTSDKFKAPVGSQAVVMVVDNDSGLKALNKAVSPIIKASLDGSQPFTHLISNLYIVLTPPGPNGGDSYMEQCFETSLLEAPHKGKTFSPSNQIDPATEFGKKAFSHEVVRPQAAAIKFDGFVPLLDRISAALSDYAAKYQAAALAADRAPATGAVPAASTP